MVVKLVLEPKWDHVFHPDSYGYRPGKSAHQALAKVRERYLRYDWAIDMENKKTFLIRRRFPGSSRVASSIGNIKEQDERSAIGFRSSAHIYRLSVLVQRGGLHLQSHIWNLYPYFLFDYIFVGIKI